MKPFNYSTRLLVFILTVVGAAVLLTGCSISLAEDITPPPNYRPAAQQPTNANQQVSVSLPQGPGDLDSGEPIYIEKCLPCHGETGLGDGPDAANLPNPAAALGDPELARQARPSDWYEMVTVGNLQRFMPGFTSLDDSARWNVVGYAFSLSTTAAEIEAGKGLYAENCAECHGASGRGDGPGAAGLNTLPGDWTVPARLAQLSAVEMAEVIAQGKGEMPAFGDRLDESQRFALAAYARSLSFSSEGSEGQIASELEAGTQTPEAPITANADPGAEPAEMSTISVTGKLQSASPDGNLPTDVKVSLTAFSGMTPAFTLEQELQADGGFRFEDVAFDPNYVYVASAQANGLNFNSDIVHGSDVQSNSIDLVIEVFETTTDTTVLKADRLHVFFDFSTPGSIQVIELFIISNPSNTVVIAPADGAAVLNFELPEGATNLQFEDSTIGQRYMETANGFGDRASISPGMGQHQVLFAYELPYDRKLDLNLVSPVPVDAAVMMLPQDGVKLKSDQLTGAGDRTVQGTSYQMYNANSVVEPGQPIKMQLTGRVSTGAAGTGDPLIPVVVSGVVFAAALGGAGYWFLRQRRRYQPVYESAEEADAIMMEEESSDALLEAIVALDDLYQAGNLPEPAYHERRAELKARLASVLSQEKGA